MSLPLFVYGTLKRSARGNPHELLGDAKFLNTASISGELYDLGSYPGVYRNGGSGQRVFGELFALADSTVDRSLKVLDRYEGSDFVRKRVYVTLPDGRRRMAWAYTLRERPDETARRVTTGRYRQGSPSLKS